MKKPTTNQTTILRVIRNNPGCSMSKAADPVRAGSHSPNQASFAAVHRCIQRGWVSYTGGQKCGQAYVLALTPAGEVALDGATVTTDDADMLLAQVLEGAAAIA